MPRPLPAMVKDDHHQMVGPDHPRILWRHRRPRLHRLQQRGMGWRTAGTVGRVLLGDLHIPRCEHAALPKGHAGHGVVQDRNPVRIFQRSEQDQEARSPTAV